MKSQLHILMMMELQEVVIHGEGKINYHSERQEKDVGCCVYVYEEWLPSALCGAARGFICDMYTQTHMSQQQTIAVTATVRLRALSGPGTKRTEMTAIRRATAEPTATGTNIILGERGVWKN